MLLCDRCKKVASVTRSLIPPRGTDLCVTCDATFSKVVQRFLSAEAIDERPPSMGTDPTPADPLVVLVEPLVDEAPIEDVIP